MRGIGWLVMVAVIAFGVAPAAAQKRVALVIGNSAYKHTSPLANPRNDATDMTAALRALGFTVVDGYDLDKAALDRRIRDFATQLAGAELAAFFYAGHGIQVDGQNYLVPIDAQLASAAALDFETVRLDLVQRTMERETKTNILFLDACRDNPLSRNLARSLGTRSAAIGRGLASAESGAGTLISFATQPGNVALDGDGRNSPFAGALVRKLRQQSGDDLSALLIGVRGDVMRATQGRQVPWEHSSLTGRVFLHRAALPIAAAPAPVVAPAPVAPQPVAPQPVVPQPPVGQPPPNATQPQLGGVTFVCGYNFGPKYGRLERFNFAAMQIGGPCHDGRGSAGIAVAEPRPEEWARLKLDPRLWSHTCRYNAGPKAGQTERYPQFGSTNVGTYCNDGFGSLGVVIPEG